MGPCQGQVSVLVFSIMVRDTWGQNCIYDL